MPTQTKGKLTPARIFETNTRGGQKGTPIYCHFNPNKYTISITNNFRVKGMSGNTNNYNLESDESSLNPRELTIQELWFDAYEEGGDVRKVTGDLMALAQKKDSEWRPPPPPPQDSQGGSSSSSTSQPKPPPAKVAFEWGGFKFLGVIKSLTVEYMLFRVDGAPVRAKASLKLTEFKKDNAFPGQNPTSGNGPTERIWLVRAGDRLDSIAAAVYNDATRWRAIAAHNQIEDPFNLQTGRELAIPAY
jgi:hypothetical protein